MRDETPAERRFRERLAARIEETGFGQKELRRDSGGVARQTIYRIVEGQMRPTLNVAVRLANALGTSVSALLGEDEGELLREDTAPYAARPFDVPLLRLDVAAGEPRLEVVPEGIRPYYFREEWLRRKGWNGDRNDDRFGVYRLGDPNIADSMAPTIQPRSVLLVDRRPDRGYVPARSIWIVRVPSGGDDVPQAPLFGDSPATRLTTKRVTLVDHQLVLESDNREARHAPRILRCRPSDLESVLVGRVIWFATELE